MGDTGRRHPSKQPSNPSLPGDSPKTAARIQGVVAVALPITAFVVCVASFAGRHIGVGIGAIIVTLLTAGIALGWLTMEGRRIRQVERDWSRVRHTAA